MPPMVWGAALAGVGALSALFAADGKAAAVAPCQAEPPCLLFKNSGLGAGQ